LQQDGDILLQGLAFPQGAEDTPAAFDRAYEKTLKPHSKRKGRTIVRPFEYQI